MKLTQFQLQELAKYWFDISKILVGSLVVKFFEPKAPEFTGGSLAAIFASLTLAFLCVILGMNLLGRVKK